jgi:hypothetical protein
MVQELGEAVEKWPNVDESRWDNDRFVAIAALPDLPITAIGPSVSF